MQSNSFHLAGGKPDGAVASHEYKAGDLLPCPFCKGEMLPGVWGLCHVSSDCWLSNVRLSPPEFESWNRRAGMSPPNEEDMARYEALEREHLGDPDKKTGIYTPGINAPKHVHLPTELIAELEDGDGTYYIAQEAAFAPGISGTWPKVIPHPTNRHGRLVKRQWKEDQSGINPDSPPAK